MVASPDFLALWWCYFNSQFSFLPLQIFWEEGIAFTVISSFNYDQNKDVLDITCYSCVYPKAW